MLDILIHRTVLILSAAIVAFGIWGFIHLMLVPVPVHPYSAGDPRYDVFAR